MKINIQHRQSLLRFLIWFSLGNACLFLLAGLRYLIIVFSSKTLFATGYFSYDYFLGRIFVILFHLITFVGDFSLLAWLPAMVVCPLIIFFNKRVVITAAIIAWSGAAAILLTDMVVFPMFHFHLNLPMAKLIMNNEYGFIHFLELAPLELALMAGIALAIIVFEIALARFVWRKAVLQRPLVSARKLVVIQFGCLIASYSMFVLSVGADSNIIAQQTPVYPFYNNSLAAILPFKDSAAFINRYSETRFAQPLFPDAPLHYPLHPLACQPQKNPYNVVIIAIDSWRYDYLNDVLTPNIAQFAKRAWVFDQHYSGGNSTQAGLFSLFYGLPGNYWNAALNQKKSALLIQALLDNRYDMNILFSSFMIPPFHKTVFNGLHHLRTTSAVGETIPDRDRTITTEFTTFLAQRQSASPFFAFLFYDAAHSYYGTQNVPQLYSTRVQPGQRILSIQSNADAVDVANRYKNAVHFVDAEVQTVLASLRQNKLLDNTIVIITSDHGEEMNDTHQAYWGHGSNYSRYQIRVPFIVYWPGMQPKTMTHLTTHYDVAPFLLKNVLGCTNSISDSSVGEALLAVHQKPFFLVGSYVNMGIVQKNKITTLLTSGNVQVQDSEAGTLADQRLDPRILSQALLEMRQYYQ